MRIVTNIEWVKTGLNGRYLVSFVEDEFMLGWHESIVADLAIVNIDRLGGAKSSRIFQKSDPDIFIIGVTEQQLLADEMAEKRSIFIEQGGNYLLQSPVYFRELLACVRRIDLHPQDWGSTVSLYNKRLKIVPKDRSVLFDECLVDFSLSETKILITLAKHLGKTVRKSELFCPEKRNTHDGKPRSNTTEVFVSRIRKRLERLELGLSTCVQTVRGQGYRLVDVGSGQLLQ